MLKNDNFHIISLQNRYIPALLIILLFSSFAYINVKNTMASISNDGKIINISGRQRMLSQRLVLLAENYIYSNTKESKKILEDNISLLSNSHDFLLDYALSQNLENLFFKNKLDEELKEFVLLFKELIKSKNKKILIILRKKSQLLLPKLDLIVKTYELEDRKKLENLEKKEFLILLSIILVLILEVIFIFQPASNEIRRNTNELEVLVAEKTNELQKSIDIISNYVIYSRTNLKGIITYASNAFCETSGYSKEELIGKPHNIVRHPDMPKDAFKEMWKTIAEGKTWKGEVKNLKKDGGSYWVDANISPEFDSLGKLIGYAAVRLNISAKKKIEELNKNLEKKVLEEVEKNRLKDKQLHEQEKLIQMGELVGNIAHQWRQPLSLISTLTSGLKFQKEMGTLSDKECFDTYDSIISKTKELSQTIDNFTSFIKDDNRKNEFIIQKRVDETMYLVSNSLENNNIKFHKDYEKEDLEIFASKSSFSQAILNIVTNAKDILIDRNLKNPLINISIKKHKQSAQIIIEDNAGGIDEKIIHKVFEPYFTTKHQSQGTGMGLHYSYSYIVKELHGELSVVNTNLGAAFIINIPIL